MWELRLSVLALWAGHGEQDAPCAPTYEPFGRQARESRYRLKVRQLPSCGFPGHECAVPGRATALRAAPRGFLPNYIQVDIFGLPRRVRGRDG